MKFLWFMLFSTIEGFAIYALSFYIFRLDMRRYLPHVVLMLLLVSFQNYVARDILALSAAAPIINLVLSTFFFVTIIRIPLVWSMVMVLTGYIGFAVLQTSLVFLSLGFISLDELQVYSWKAYILQALTGITGWLIGWILYKKRLGFTFDFEDLRFKWEKVLIPTLIAVILVGLAGMLYYRDLVVNLIGMFLTLIIFLVYSIKKETDELERR
ncbi:hypothetical protein DNH61_24190 [Paenibacillus sambharensis]|uniref:Uncharacterized protein n=1 Tax=Paenibacillus sambharensis TaxID=1803190 RepID=A0A2W1LDK5_9BACL|nr:hypothetical protein [Paenibacillus sambharensis]PZD93152.1 hypothetical protein DNH61_24190 [Paenibacillus sambharensis]